MVDSCYECESLRISYRFLKEEDDGTQYFEAICRDCRTSWEESAELLDSLE